MTKRRYGYNRASVFLCLVFLAGCGSDDTAVTSQVTPNVTTVPMTIDKVDTDNLATTSAQNKTLFEIGNSRYLFDVTEHGVEELHALLERIDEITEASPEAFTDLEIVMILHGPDIDLFTQRNYVANKRLVDLAAKLDAFRVIDMKVCETAMNSLGVDRQEIPAFIEPVPYAPDSMRELRAQGYINL